jgi:ribosomal protein L32
MAVPKKKLSASKRHIKRQHEKVAEIAVSKCNQCARSIPMHFACKSCFKK